VGKGVRVRVWVLGKYARSSSAFSMLPRVYAKLPRTKITKIPDTNVQCQNTWKVWGLGFGILSVGFVVQGVQSFEFRV
jgi:hypothetical protein